MKLHLCMPVLSKKKNQHTKAPDKWSIQGPVVQSIVSLINSLVVKLLTVLVSIISNSQVFLLKKCEYLLKTQKLLTFFSKNISTYAIFNYQSFKGTLTNDVISFEQLGPDVFSYFSKKTFCRYALAVLLWGISNG